MKGLKLHIETYKSEIEGFRQWLILGLQHIEQLQQATSITRVFTLS